MDDRWRERLRWRSRRGLLENDLLLSRYLDKAMAAMPEAELKMLEKLLLVEDNDLLDLLMGRTVSDDPGLAALIANIRSSSGGPGQ